MPTPIVTRAGKGSALTFTEMDANFVNLKATADAAATLGGNIFTGTQSLPHGDPVTPSLNFGDAGSGFYWPAANRIGITLNGAQIGQFDGTNGLSMLNGNWVAFESSGTIGNATTRIRQSAANRIVIDQADGNYSMLQFAGTSSAFPALKRSGAALAARLADDSGAADVSVNNLTIGAGIASPGTPSAPAFLVGTTTDCGFYRDSTVGANAIAWTASGTASGRLLQAEMNFVSNGLMSWGNQVNTFSGSSTDAAIRRESAGLLGITNGSGATYRDLKLRQLYPDFTNTGTVGAVTINKACGQAILAAAATQVVVTNNLVTANSQILCTIAQNDATATIKNVVAAAGSFTITATAAATANTAINFLVLNQ